MKRARVAKRKDADQRDGQRVLVTAGGAGIGFAIARAFRTCGARVWICGTSQSRLRQILSENPDWSGSVADVGDPTAVDQMFERVGHELGGLDVLVNNAGVSGPMSAVDQIATADWASTLAVNLSGPFYCIRRAVPFFKQQGHGVILNIATTSVRVALPNRLPYVASKAALIEMTRALARELGPFGIRCNAISPGMVNNARSSRIRRARATDEGITEGELLERRLRFISMRRMVSEADIGDLAVFLASNRAANISGQHISVCGNLEWE